MSFPAARIPTAWVYRDYHELQDAGAEPPHPHDLRVTALSTAQDDWQQELNVQASVPVETSLIQNFKISLISSIFICIPNFIVQNPHLQQKP